MDFSKYLPKYLIIKNVLNLNGSTVTRYFISLSQDLNLDYFKNNNIQSWHPLIVKDGSNFYYFKGLKQQDFLLASFVLNNENCEPEYNNQILENYFEKNSYEI